jgi:hypothetical protein
MKIETHHTQIGPLTVSIRCNLCSIAVTTCESTDFLVGNLLKRAEAENQSPIQGCRIGTGTPQPWGRLPCGQCGVIATASARCRSDDNAVLVSFEPLLQLTMAQ